MLGLPKQGNSGGKGQRRLQEKAATEAETHKQLTRKDETDNPPSEQTWLPSKEYAVSHTENHALCLLGAAGLLALCRAKHNLLRTELAVLLLQCINLTAVCW